MIGIILICIISADFFTGIVHWFEDTYGLPSWPIIGAWVIEPNIEHHEKPSLIGRMGTFASRNLQPILLAIIGFGTCCFFGTASWPVLLVAALAAFGNEVHCWNHRVKNNRFITFLQNSGLVQSRRQHAMHHRPPYDRYYCVLTSFTNEVLELLDFWRRLEWLVSMTLGVDPKRLSPERRGY